MYVPKWSLLKAGCVLAFNEEDGVQEIYSTTFKNKSSLSEEDFYKAITNQCDVEELYVLRYEEFNKKTSASKPYVSHYGECQRPARI